MRLERSPPHNPGSAATLRRFAFRLMVIIALGLLWPRSVTASRDRRGRVKPHPWRRMLGERGRVWRIDQEPRSQPVARRGGASFDRPVALPCGLRRTNLRDCPAADALGAPCARPASSIGSLLYRQSFAGGHSTAPARALDRSSLEDQHHPPWRILEFCLTRFRDGRRGDKWLGTRCFGPH